MKPPRKNELRKPSRSISGIVPVAVMLSPRKCNHGTCLYCPSLNVPQSYTPKSPVVLRASQLNYNSCEQVKARIKSFRAMNHPTDKVEVIIMGGTFLSYPKNFQYDFVKGIYDGLNGKKSKTLLQAEKLNELAEHRCVALCVETRPDVCVDFVERLLEFGITRVELGVQMPDDAIYKKINRGHSVKDVIVATKVLKNAGFKVGYHIMPGLPESYFEKDLKLFRKLFSDERFKPDQLKIYPCQVLKNSELENLYWKGKYKPYSEEETKKLLVKMLKIVPRYCRVMRVMREIPPEYLTAGILRIDLRKEVEEELRKEKAEIKEIRWREVGFADKYKFQINERCNLKLKITEYEASGGKEFFLEFVDEGDVLFGLCRLRIFDVLKKNNSFSLRSDIYNKLIKNNPVSNFNFSETEFGAKNKNRAQQEKVAIVRELHIYGRALNLGKKSSEAQQHRGMGKELMREAEKIAKEQGVKEIKIISGVGVREYYKKIGYELKNSYMIKKL